MTPATATSVSQSTCPRCGNQVRPDARFCPFCGLRLQDVTSSQLLAGTLLANGRYFIQRLLGQGGMGAVYLAEDRHLSRPCVVKELQVYTDSAQEATRAANDFRREALILAHLSADQPNIPQTYDHFSEGLRHYLVMQYIAGENLEQRLRRLGPLPEREVLQDALAICDTLVFIHNQKPEPVVHRDIKPANIIVDTQARIKLVDFGLAKTINTDTGALTSIASDGLSTAAGTAGYTPIEQWMGHAQPASDIYALGATMHHLLSGRDPRDPFNAYPELNLDIIRRLTTFPPLRQLRANVTPATERLVERMLSLNPAERPTAAQVRAAISDILAAPPPPTAGQLMSMSDRQLGTAPVTSVASPSGNPPANPLLSRAVPVNPTANGNSSNSSASGTYSGPRLDRISNSRRVGSLGERLNPQGGALTASYAFRFSSNDDIRPALTLYLRGLIQFLPLNEPLDVYPQSLTLLPLYLIVYALDTVIPLGNRWLRKQGAVIMDGSSGAALDAPLADLWLPEWKGINVLSTPAEGTVSTPGLDTIQQIDFGRLPAGYGPLPPPKPYVYDDYELQQRARRELSVANEQLFEYPSLNMSQTVGPRPEDFVFNLAIPIYAALWNANVLLRGQRYTISVYEGSRMGQYRGRPSFLMRETNMPGRGFCTVCGKLFPPEQLVQCRNCGKAVCANDAITTGILNKKVYCSVECAERGR